jgi:hypothetical protein
MGGDVVVASVPASGSAFVVGLPAVAEVPRGVVGEAIGGAVEAEEIGLEERAVLRALRADGGIGGRAAGRQAGRGARGSGDPVGAAQRADDGLRGAGMPEVDAA